MTDRCEAASRFVHLVAGRWTLTVLAELATGGRRYHDLLDAVKGISPKVLTDTLRRAERDGGLDGARDLVPGGKVQTTRGADAGRMLRDVSTLDEQGRGGVRPLDFIDQRVHPGLVETLLKVFADVDDEGAVRHVEDLYPDLRQQRFQHRCARRAGAGHRPVVP